MPDSDKVAECDNLILKRIPFLLGLLKKLLPWIFTWRIPKVALTSIALSSQPSSCNTVKIVFFFVAVGSVLVFYQLETCAASTVCQLSAVDLKNGPDRSVHPLGLQELA